MENSPSLLYENSKKIFFIYSQNYFHKEINEINKNEYLEDIILVKDIKKDKQMHLIYSLILNNKYQKEPIILEIIKKNIAYSSKIEIHDLNSEIFLYKIDFTNKNNIKELTQFTLDYSEQFKIFAELKNDANVKIGLSNDYLKNLCLNSLEIIGSSKELLNLDFLCNVFIYSYSVQKTNEKENLIRKLLNFVNIESIDIKNIDIKYKKENKLNYKFCDQYLNKPVNVEKILKELVKMGGEDNIEKIHIFLAYYYLKYFPKNFIYLISLNNDFSKNIFNNLTNNRKIFQNFSSDIINFDVLDEAESIKQIQNVLKYMPNMEEFLKSFLSTQFFLKVSGLSELENNFIDVLKVMQPRKEDNLEKIANNFLIIMQLCENEKIMIFNLSNTFFLSYAGFYEKIDLEKLKIVKDIYNEYCRVTNINERNRITQQLNDIYYDTGIHLIKEKNALKNEELINFFEESGKEEINIPTDIMTNVIDLQTASEEFKNKFLNNDFKKLDLEAAFGINYYDIIQKIFDKFKKQEDILVLKNWKISQNVNGKILNICLKKIKLILIEEAKECKKNNKKFVLYTDLISFLCSLLSISSRKIKDLVKELSELEQNVPSTKIIEIYFLILYRGNKVFPITEIFADHLKDYIKKNSGEGPLSILYKLVLIENVEKILYLVDNLKIEYAVKNTDFVGYPRKIEERIVLYKYLYNEKYFTNKNIKSLDYYKSSIKAKDELINLTYEEGMKIYNNYFKFFDLFKIFIPKELYKEKTYYNEFISFYDKLGIYKAQYDDLKHIYNYWKSFYPISKKNLLEELIILQKSLLKTPLNEFDSKKNIIDGYLKYLKDAKNSNNLHKSYFFMAIYEFSKTKFDQEKENEIFNDALEEFKNLKKLEISSNIDDLGEQLKNIIINCAKQHRKNLINELYFIQDYFGFNKIGKENNENEFNIENILIQIEKLLPVEDDNKPIIKPDNNPVINPNPEPIYDDSILKEIKKLFEKFFKFYLNQIQEGNEEEFLNEYISIFKEIFKYPELSKLSPNSFIKEIINILKKIQFLGFYYNFHKYSIQSREIYLINDFFEILEVYQKIYNNNIEDLAEYVKKIFPLIQDRMFYEGFKIDFEKITNNIFTEIIGSDKAAKQIFSNCFVNILIGEIKKEKLNRTDLDKILDYVLNPATLLLDNCIPLINLLFKDTFFANFKNSSISNIIFKDISLNFLEKKLDKSQDLQEILLFYFESNLNKMIEEKYDKNLFKEVMIRDLVSKSISYLKEGKSEGHRNISLLFSIAFLKIIMYKYINGIENNRNFIDAFYNKEISEYDDYFSYYAIKIFVELDGYLNLNKQSKIVLSDNIGKKIQMKNETKKYFGFDYLFLQMDKEKKEAKTYNEILKKIQNSLNRENNLNNDIGIVNDIKNNNIDILFCVFVNLYLSNFCDEDYFGSNEYDILHAWFNDKFVNDSFQIKNKSTIEILKIFNNLKDEKRIKYESNNELINILFALRLVLNTMSQNKKNDTFFYNLITNTNQTIQKNSNIFIQFFKDNTKIKDKEAYHLIRFILLAHLLFGYLLNNIELDEIKIYTDIEIEEQKAFKSLTEEFNKIANVIRYKGIKNKYKIIYMNIISNDLKNIKLSNIDNDSGIKYLLRLDKDHYKNEIKRYFDILKEIGMDDQKMEMNEFKKIVFEDYDFYKNNIKNYSYLKYLSVPNFCTIDDFENQYNSKNISLPMIDYVLSNKMDYIINIINCLPEINDLINRIYNEKILKINRETAKNEKANINDYDGFNKNISKICDYLKIKTEEKVKEISNISKIIDIINFKESKIFKMYESLNKIITDYNNFLKSLTIFSENEQYIKYLKIQDFSKKDSFYLNVNEINEQNSLAFDRLKELIIIYSKRKRYENDALNVYNGDRIYYDFESIEKNLIRDFILGKKLLEKSQRIFIFSNEIFANERRDILLNFKKKYPQDKIKNDKIKQFELELGKLEEDDNLPEIVELYRNLIYIIIYLMSDYKDNKDNISLKELGTILNKSGYRVKKLILSDDLHINNIFVIYEILEMKSFSHFEETLKNDKRLNPDNIKSDKKKVEKYFENEELFLNEDILKNGIKKYIMRYCIGDYEKSNEILKNFNVENMLLKEDIWDNEIFNDKRFNKEKEMLKDLNKDENNCLENYFLCDIFNIGSEEQSENPDEEKEESEEGED